MSGRLSDEQVLEVIVAAVARVLELAPESLSRTSVLVDDLGADSLAIVEIVEVIEEALGTMAPPGFRIEDEDVDRIHTIGDAVDYVSAKL